MFELRTILHATDFSDASRPALDHALVWAELFEAKLLLLHVETPRTADPFLLEKGFPDPPELTERLRTLAHSEMTTLLEAHAERPLEIRELFRNGYHAETEIVEAAREEGADLMVLGTHGRRGASHLLMGSIASEVLRRTPCPALVVPSRVGSGAVGVRRILVPVDFSAPARRAARFAAELAVKFGATLELLHVIPPLDAVVPMNLGGIGSVSIVSELEPVAENELARVGEELGSPTELVRTVWHGPVVPSILNRAAATGAGLLVVGSTGRTGLDRLLLGSVAENVARLSTVPVLVVPPAHGDK